SPYTWYSRRLRQHLDRVLVTDSWMDVFPKTQVTHLELSKSDHRGLLVVVETIVTQKASSFRFQHMWITHPGFLEVVHRNWQYPTIGSGMARLQQKFTHLKHCLKEWNKTVFGNVFDSVAAVERDLKEVDEAYDLDPCDRTLVEQNRCSAVLVRVLTQEEAFWKQKARIKWAKDRERNTRYFHSLVKKRRFREPVFFAEMDRDCLEDGLTDEDSFSCAPCQQWRRFGRQFSILRRRVLQDQMDLGRFSIIPVGISSHRMFLGQYLNSFVAYDAEEFHSYHHLSYTKGRQPTFL
ncbi:UNVERIFIED_CONTAM: hypothetical protein Sindi_1451800, partial [Sesamum indicum]